MMNTILGKVKALTDIGKEHQNQIMEGSEGLLIKYRPNEESYSIVFPERGVMEFQMNKLLFHSLFNIDWFISKEGSENTNEFTMGGGINVNEETDSLEEAIDLIKTNQNMTFDFDISDSLTEDEKNELMELAKTNIEQFFNKLYDLKK